MKTNELIFDNLIDLPKSRIENNKVVWFPKFIEKTLNEYYDKISKIKDLEYNQKNFSELLISSVKIVNDYLLKSIEAYYKGNPFEAYKYLDDLLNYKKGSVEIFNFLPRTNLSKPKKNYYRIRYSSENILFNAQDLFHIPFQIREKVKTQRYSIPGYPSLYLSNSIYVAWEELGRPDFNKFQAARFEVKNDKYLELFTLIHPEQIRNEHFSNKPYKYDKNLLDFLVVWPLIFLGSIKVALPNEIFKPEYIIPQLLFQWIKNNIKTYHGIKYFCNHIDYSGKSKGEFYNVVLPTQENKSKGYCKTLQSFFCMTNPVSKQLIDVLTGGQTFYSDPSILEHPEINTIEIIKDKEYPYSYSKFAELEHYLKETESRELNFD